MKTLFSTFIAALLSVLLIAPTMAEVRMDTPPDYGTSEQNDDGC
jgi:hypothetical protein